MIDFAPIIVAQNSLTKFLKSVDSQSFFDISNVFPIGGESGIRVKVTFAQRAPETVSAGSDGGPARI